MKKLQQYLLTALAAILVACPAPVVTPPTINTLTASPSSLPIGGGETTLAWQVDGATSLAIDQNVGVVTGNQKTITTNTTTTYTLTATNSAGNTQKTVVVTVAQAKPTITAFTAGPATLPFGGGSSTLAWQVTGADSLSIDQGVGTVTGTDKVVSLTTTKTYTLTAINSQGETTKTVTINVAQEPADKIMGTLDSWTRGARVLKGKVYVNGNAQNIAQGTLTQAGELDLTLPPALTNLDPIFTSSTCGTTLVLTPADTKGASATFDIVTATDKMSGQLYRSNLDNNFTGPTPTGFKRVNYIYVDKASTWKGSCTSNGQTQTVDATFQQGWNTVLFEVINSTTVRISTDPTPTDVTWRFTPTGSMTINSANTALEVGDTTTLSAIAEDGYQFLASDINWSSDNPSVLEINPNGVVTAKKTGAVQIRASVKSATFITNYMYINVGGLIASGSTYNLEDQSLGTAIRLSYSGMASTDFQVTIVGPPSWNNDQPLVATYKNGFGYPTTILSEIPVVSGTYTVRRATKTTGGVTFAIDASQRLASVKNVIARNSSTAYASLSWDVLPVTPPGQLIQTEYSTEIIDAQTGVIIKERASSYSPQNWYDLALDTTRTYKFRVYAIQFNPDIFYGASVASTTLDFRPVITDLIAQGGVATGGNNIIINGSNFDINTRVFFGTSEVTSKTLNSSNSMTVVVPASIASTVDVTMQNTRGTSVVSALTKYTYYGVTEFNASNPTNLLKGNNGDVYFLETDFTGSSPALNLVKVSANTSASRVAIPNFVGYDSARDMTLDAFGNVWISFSNKFVKVTPANATSEIALPSGVQPAALTFGADGNIWFLRTDSAKIGRIQPDGTNATEFSVPAGNFGFGGFSVSSDIVLATDGNFWFTQYYGGVGRITPSGSITLLANISGNKILVHDNAIWIGNGSITRIAFDGTITSIGNCGNQLAVGSDGYFWCVGNYSSGATLGRRTITTTSSNVQPQIISVSSNNSVSDIISDSNGKLWFIVGNKVSVLMP